MDQLGPYKISGELGRGGMGVVYRGRDERIGRDVAIKTIKLSHEDAQEKDVFRQRLLRDAQLAGILSHPGIVTVYELAEEGDITYIVMELVNGPTLHELLARPGGIQLEQALEVLRQTAGALDYAHKKGVVHRDIKPANIMVDDGDTVKIVDFGTAKLFTAAHTQTGFLLGTPYYMSPEQVYSKPLDGRSDQFALAVIAFEILLGHRPFQGDSLPSLVHKIVSEAPQVNSDDRRLPLEALAVLEKALAKNPTDRFANCCAFIKELHDKMLPGAVGSGTQTFTQNQALPHSPPPSSGPLVITVGSRSFNLAPTGIFSRIGRKKTVFATSGVAIVLLLVALVPQYLTKNREVTKDRDLDKARLPAVTERAPAPPPTAAPAPALPSAAPAVPPPSRVEPSAKELADASAAKKQAAKALQTAKLIPPAIVSPPAAATKPVPHAAATKPSVEVLPSGSGCIADYTGVPSGTINWAGNFDQPGSLQIRGSSASAGRLAGKLPNVPLTISGALPPGATIVQRPTDANKCAPLTIRITEPVNSLHLNWQAQ